MHLSSAYENLKYQSMKSSPSGITFITVFSHFCVAVFSGVFWMWLVNVMGSVILMQNPNLHPQDCAQEFTSVGHDRSEELKRTPGEPVTYLSHCCSAKLHPKISKTSSLPTE